MYLFLKLKREGRCGYRDLYKRIEGSMVLGFIRLFGMAVFFWSLTESWGRPIGTSILLLISIPADILHCEIRIVSRRYW